ncbi:MAG: 50S ribosomal protein L9 [Proteobacteria bacterium]|nr:50S ribosomal protein L9 [Pseudomonadota bacterium]MBU1059327.1 50S ribosomal protein L9 [Pseudomonadota bacterium]
MEVILKETIDTLGREGDIVNVKPGYGRNYLLPQMKAVLANERNIAMFEENKASIQARIEEEIKAADALAKKIAGTTISIAMLAGSDERLFGSVTSSDISKKLAEVNIDVDKKQIVLQDAIKNLGETTVTIKVGFQKTVEITVLVVPLMDTMAA